jgi:tetratricopeptide (TPR) repeat protein
MRHRRGWLPAFILLVTLAGSARSEWKESEAAKHFEKALAHVDRKEFDEAIVEFQKAHEIFPNYSVHYNIGLAHGSAGKPSRAVRAFELYLQEGGAKIPLERRERVAALIRSAREKLGRLRVTVLPANATLKVDGEIVKPDPAGVELDAGPHVLVLAAPGYVERTWSVTVNAREVLVIDAALAPRPARSLVVRCPVPDVSVEVDGRPLAVTRGDADVLLRDVAANAQELTFKRAGYEDHVVAISSLDLRLPTVCQLAPQPSAMTARLDLEIREPGAQVSIDGALYRSVRQFVHQPGECFIGFQLRVGLDDHQQAGQCARLLVGGLDLLRGRGCAGHLRARVSDGAKDVLLLLGEPLGRFNQVRNQITAALQLILDLRPLRLDCFFLSREAVVRTARRDDS